MLMHGTSEVVDPSWEYATSKVIGNRILVLYLSLFIYVKSETTRSSYLSGFRVDVNIYYI
jgi:hypothetical protein